MSRHYPAGLALLFTILLGACAWLASPEAKTIEKDVLRTVDILCILNNSMLEVSAISQACSLEKKFEPAIVEVLSAHRAAARRERVGACPGFDCNPWVDAGHDAAKDAHDRD